MKIFRILFALLPFIALAYVMWRSWRLMPFPVWAKAVVMVVMLGLVVMMIVSMLPGALDGMPLLASSVIYKVSLSWIFILLYLLIAFLVVDVLALAHVVPAAWHVNSLKGTAALAALMFVVFAAGNVNYHHKHREAISLKTEKPLDKPLKIVMLSDMHLGYHIRRAELSRWVDKINAENPDLILVAGDIIDRSVAPLLKEKSYEEFRRLKAPVVACPGNHEYYAGIDDSEDFFKLAGITMLRDSAITLKGVNIIGRDDRTNGSRKPLEALMSRVDPHKYTILLDHQPFNLEEAMQDGVDFELCGHTHHGQLWPISWITDAIYEDAYGPLQKGDTKYYVSSGMGIWGGKFRIGTRSEYAVATLE